MLIKCVHKYRKLLLLRFPHRTVFDSSSTGSCGVLTLRPLLCNELHHHTVSIPAMIRSRVDLPEPFRPKNTDFGAAASQRNVFKNLTLRWNSFCSPETCIYVFSHCRSIPLIVQNCLLVSYQYPQRCYS